MIKPYLKTIASKIVFDIKSDIKTIVPKETWNDMSTHKRNVKSMFEKSNLSMLLSDNPEIKKQKKIVIIGAADYENLGDHAIAHAQYQFINDLNLGYPIYEIPSRTPVRHIKSMINSNDILVFTGGGNLGTKYGFLQDIFLPIIKKYPNNRKIFMPQSYTFAEDTSSNLMNKIKSAFAKSGHNLTITAREPKSYELFKKTFPDNQIIETPDIVLSLQLDQDENKDANGILMLMRNDGEKVLSFEFEKSLIESLEKTYSVTVPDKELEQDVHPQHRLGALFEHWNEVKNHKLVITDKLHGMIIAQIMGVPCIVFDNYNSKIKMTCEKWLSDRDSICFIDPRKPLDMETIIKQVQTQINSTAKPFEVAQKYKPLTQVFNSINN